MKKTEEGETVSPLKIGESAVNQISPDLSNLKDILRKYDAQMRGYEGELALDMKTYAKAASEQAGHIAFYDELRCELEVMYEDMLQRLASERGLARKEILGHDHKAYTETAMSSLVEATPAVVKHAKNAKEVLERLLKMKAIVTSFIARGRALYTITEARKQDFHNERIYVNE